MKRKDSRDLVLSDDQLVYLRDEFVRLCIIDADLQSLVALPTAVDQNEWLATNSKWSGFCHLLCSSFSFVKANIAVVTDVIMIGKQLTPSVSNEICNDEVEHWSVIETMFWVSESKRLSKKKLSKE